MSTLFTPWRRTQRRRAAASAAALLVGLFGHCAAQAQATVPQATGASAAFPISGFEVKGDNPLSPQDVARVLAPFTGPNGNLLVLQQASAALEDELKAQGFALHRVSLPPQEMGSRVTLLVVKFGIGQVSLEGNTRLSAANIRASIPEIREGEAPNLNALAIQTAIANENPGKQIQVSLKESTEADMIDIKVLVKEAAPWTFSVSVANTGSDTTGNDRVSVVGGYSNVFDLDQQFSGAYTTSVVRIKEVKQLGLNYTIPLYQQGGVLGLSYTNSDVVGGFGTFTSTGAGQTFGVNFNYYLQPDGGRHGFLTAALDQKIFNASITNGAALAAGQPQRITSCPLSLGYNERVESDSAQWSYSTVAATNLSCGAGNDLSDYQNANAGPATPDTRIHSSHWAALRGGGNYTSSFATDWSWTARAQFQYSAQALISGEQFGLGGGSSVRGTAERPVSGDSGLSATLEITSSELYAGLRALGFVDAGWLRNNHPGVDPNKPAQDRLASAGLGLRYAQGPYSVSGDWARVVQGSVLSTTAGATIPHTGEQKLHVNLTARF